MGCKGGLQGRGLERRLVGVGQLVDRGLILSRADRAVATPATAEGIGLGQVYVYAGTLRAG